MNRLTGILLALLFGLFMSSASADCSTCGGSGRSLCPVCHGNGKVTGGYQYGNFGFITGVTTKDCDHCNGYGRVTCQHCNGSGNATRSSWTERFNKTCNICGGSGGCKVCFGRGGTYNSYTGFYYPCGGCAGGGRCKYCKGKGTQEYTIVHNADGTATGYCDGVPVNVY